MKIRVVLTIILIWGIAMAITAQQYDLLIKGGHVIDPKNDRDGLYDVAITGSEIAEVSSNISADLARKVIDGTGMYVTPGLIDIHTHVFVGSETGQFAGGFSSVSPDDFTFRSGVTTVVDAGTSGWRNFPEFKETVINPSRTRVLAFLNISGSGMLGGPFEQDLMDMDPKLTSMAIRKYKDIIVGTKIGHFHADDWRPFEFAIEAGERSGVPLFLECHLPELPLEELLAKMRPGDIFTHAFGDVNDRESILDDAGNIRQYVIEARDKGIYFDVGHGGGSFHYNMAIPAYRQGFLPDAFGTDLHRFSMNAGMKNMLNIMSKYLNIGMSIQDIIHRATWNSAQIIKRENLGNLSVGSEADLAVFSIQEGSFGFVDAGGYKIDGDKKLEAELTIRAGSVVWDLNGMAAKIWQE